MIQVTRKPAKLVMKPSLVNSQTPPNSSSSIPETISKFQLDSARGIVLPIFDVNLTLERRKVDEYDTGIQGAEQDQS